MDSALKGMFGGGNDAAAKDFVNRVTTGDPTQGYTHEEAAAALEHVTKNASPETIQRATTQAVNNLSEDQRKEFAQMLQQRQAQGRPEIQQSSGAAAPSGGGIEDMLGGLLGGGGSSGGGGGLGEVLGGLLGGGGGGMLGGLLGGGGGAATASTGAVQPAVQPADSQGGGMGSLLGDLMKSPVGKAVVAGIGAFAMKEMLDHRN